MKCLSWLKTSVSVSTRPNDPKLHHTASKKLVQTTLTLCKGQFLVERGTTAVPPCPWQKFLKPHLKTDKMRFYNGITQEIYESAYVALQTRFATYLNGQQQFCWDVTKRIRRLKAVLANCEEDNLKFVSLQKDLVVLLYRVMKSKENGKGRRSRSVKTKTEFPWSGKLESFWQTIILHRMLLTEFVPIHMERSH